jgi:hypothetical protein
MCHGSSMGSSVEGKSEDPAYQLRKLFLSEYPDILPVNKIREVIRDNWPELQRLAHQIHEQESDEYRLKSVIAIVSNLNEDGIRNVIKGTASKAAIDAFKLVASKVK